MRETGLVDILIGSNGDWHVVVKELVGEMLVGRKRREGA